MTVAQPSGFLTTLMNQAVAIHHRLGELGQLRRLANLGVETRYVFLYSRPDKWDNSSLSTGPAPVKLEDGNWLLFYDIDNLWPVQDPKLPFPYYGRCSLGWAILDAKNLTKVLARAEEPLVYAQLPWEVDGFTPLVVYTMGIKSEGNDLFTLYAGGGDRVVEAFSVKVTGSGHGHYNVM